MLFIPADIPELERCEGPTDSPEYDSCYDARPL